MDTTSCYHIRINGHLEERWLNWFEDSTVEYLAQDHTLITVWVADQPALFGILNRIRDLGLELISVQKVEE